MLTELISFSLVAFTAIFFIVDPFAVVPAFLVMTEHDSQDKRRLMALRACLVSGSVLVFFTFGGSLLFKMLGLTIGAFKIAGGVLLLLTAVDMLQSRTSSTRTTPNEIAEAVEKEDIAVVPLAVPLLAGPGAIATVMMLAEEAKGMFQLAIVMGSVLITAFVSYWVLRGALVVNRVLKKSGQAILGRIMGLLLAAIGVQFMVNGVRESFPEVFRTSTRVRSVDDFDDR